MVNQDQTVRVGSWVEIHDGDLREGWRIVAAHDADISRRLLSEEVPLAKALLGHGPGDVVRVREPRGGSRNVTILDVD
jgi:transcription elongation factor GreA